MLNPKIGAAAIAIGVGMTGATFGVGFANAFPLAPPCNDSSQATCQPSPGGGDNGQSGNNKAPQSTQNNAPQSTPPQSPQNNGSQGGGNNNAPQNTQNNAPQSTAPQSPQNNEPQSGGNNNAPQSTQSNAPQNPQGGNDNKEPQDGNNAPPSTQNNAPSSGPSEEARQPYRPSGALNQGNDQVGGPRDAPHGFSTPENGAPPPPPEKGPGWNDGAAPGAAPANWDGPPPAGGWDGSPPPGGWNRKYDGPARDISQARNDFGSFNYNDYTAIPVFNPTFGGWGFWYFGVWIPLF